MKYIFITCLLVLLSFTGISQGVKKQLKELNSKVDSIEKGVQNRHLMEMEARIQELNAKLDTLNLKNKLLKMEMMLKDADKSKGANLSSKEISYETDAGYYLILASSKYKSEILRKFDRIANQSADYNLRIYYSKVSSWYHVMIDEKYISKKKILVELEEYRKDGYPEAWALPIGIQRQLTNN